MTYSHGLHIKCSFDALLAKIGYKLEQQQRRKRAAIWNRRTEDIEGMSLNL
jgi:hypothetical protein